MSCETNSELLELYALGVLDAEEREQVESHLRENCIRCTAGLATRERVQRRSLWRRCRSAAIAGIASSGHEQYSPEAYDRPPLAWIGVAAGLAAATIWLGLENQRRSKELSVARIESRNLQQRSEELSRSLTFLRDPETRPAVSKPDANKPRGTYFVNPQIGCDADCVELACSSRRPCV